MFLNVYTFVFSSCNFYSSYKVSCYGPQTSAISSKKGTLAGDRRHLQSAAVFGLPGLSIAHQRYDIIAFARCLS